MFLIHYIVTVKDFSVKRKYIKRKRKQQKGVRSVTAVTVVSIIIGVIFAVVIILFVVAIAMGEIVMAMLFSTIASFLASAFSIYVEIQNKRKRKKEDYR